MQSYRSRQPRKLNLSPDTTIEEARHEVEYAATEPGGVSCCVCAQTLAVYRRTINPGICEIVLRLASRDQAQRGRYHDVAEILRSDTLYTRIAGGGDWAKAAYWGLIEKHPTEARWRVTPRGTDFCRGILAVDSCLLVLRNEVIGVASESESRTITEIVGQAYRIQDIFSEDGGPTMSDLQDAIQAAGEW